MAVAGVAVTSRPKPWTIWIAELCEAAGPRLAAPDRPHLVCGFCRGDPVEYVERLIAGEASGHALVQRWGVKARNDLLDRLPKSVQGKREYARRRDARVRAAKIRERLRSDGWCVGGGDETFRVYVVELSDDVGPRGNPDKPWLYVGQTQYSPEVRFEKHKAGGRDASKWVYKYGLWLRPDLYEDRLEVAFRQDVLLLERDARLELEAAGYSVKGATELLPNKDGKRG